MKKLLLMAATVALLLTSCGKDDPAEGINIEKTFKSTATIKGYAYVNTNTSGTTVQATAPVGTQLVFTVSNNAYGAGKTGNYVKSTTVDANGAFAIELPARTDGTPVMAKITGDPVLVDIDMDGVVKKQIFEVKADSIAIVKSLTYQKKLTYDGKANLVENADWAEGSYKVALKYHNGKEDIAVPEGTEVKVTINKDKFVPERSNNLVFIETVGANGIVDFTINAPSLLYDGLNFTMKSAFIGEHIAIEAGTEIASKYIFAIDSVAGTIYGGETNDAGIIEFKKEDAVEEGEADWKNANYTVKIHYIKDLTDLTATSAIPSDAKITIKTTNRNTINSVLNEITTIKAGSEANPLTATFSAPNPAVASTALSFTIKVDFIADIIINADGDKEKRKFSQTVVSSSIWGGIDKKYNNDENIVVVDHTSFTTIN